ncbi:MAG: protease modulator HflC [Candidatus Tectomicrobia bacterium]|uniref:Protein HflC n=1 Tax=Tectimicrobiota bacterium TaxID=2528274 RepID=A0A933GJD0_UNCTE|nr:protease modulator HflC [Candidatus Tectomicrobia bacterium]
MKSNKLIVLIIVILALVVLLKSSFYTIDQTQQVVVTQFGKPVGDPRRTPGLKMKIPFIQQVNYFDKRILEWDGKPNQIPTMDKKYIWVDIFARWRIQDPLLYLQRVTDEERAHGRIDGIVNGAARDVIQNNILIELVRNSNRPLQVDELEGEIRSEEAAEKVRLGRQELTRRIKEQASKNLETLGIELVDVQIKRINYVQEVRKKVYERMISERKRIAEKFRSEGEGKKAEIEGLKERELQKIRSEAYKTAQEVMGAADAEATKIYAESFSKDPEFYSFVETLNTYKETLGKESSLIMGTDSDYFKFLKKLSPDDVSKPGIARSQVKGKD